MLVIALFVERLAALRAAFSPRQAQTPGNTPAAVGNALRRWSKAYRVVLRSQGRPPAVRVRFPSSVPRTFGHAPDHLRISRLGNLCGGGRPDVYSEGVRSSRTPVLSCAKVRCDEADDRIPPADKCPFGGGRAVCSWSRGWSNAWSPSGRPSPRKKLRRPATGAANRCQKLVGLH